MASGTLGNELSKISVKQVLKTTLLLLLKKLDIASSWSEKDLPLNHLASSQGIQYQSAVAVKLTANKLSKSTQFADLIINSIAAPLSTRCARDLESFTFTKADIDITASSQGWLTIALLDTGITAWLRYVDTVDLTADGSPTLADLDLTGLTQKGDHWPLCSQLALSLPMLLQFGYARCGIWLRHLEISDLPEDSCTSAVELAWTQDSPAVCHVLLQTVVVAIDVMADRGDRASSLRQGYAIVEAIYQLDAQLPIATARSQPLQVRIAIRSVLVTARKVLSAILIGVGQLPADHL